MLFDWKIEQHERVLVDRIVNRALMVFGGCKIDRLELEMDIIACHKYGQRLNLTKLLAFKQFDFAHDIAGIRRHLNRETGQLEGFFLPRSSEPKGG